MLARLLQTGGEAQQLALGIAGQRRRCPRGAVFLRSGCRSCPRRACRSSPSVRAPERFAQHAGARATAGADHDRDRRREAEGARAGDDQHRDRVDQRKAPSPAPAQHRPRDEGDCARRRSRPARTSRRRDRPAPGSARASAAPGDHGGRSGPAACRADPLGAHDQRPMALTVPPVTGSPGRLRHRQRLAGDHRLVDLAGTSSTTPSTGIFSPGRTRSRSPA